MHAYSGEKLVLDMWMHGESARDMEAMVGLKLIRKGTYTHIIVGSYHHPLKRWEIHSARDWPFDPNWLKNLERS